MGCPAIQIQSVADITHVLFNLSLTLSVSKVAGDVKKDSSKWMKQYCRGFAWQGGYGAFSVSESNAGKVRSYIKNQERHHLKVTFQDELRTLLKKHNIEFDEEYLWS